MAEIWQEGLDRLRSLGSVELAAERDKRTWDRSKLVHEKVLVRRNNGWKAHGGHVELLGMMKTPLHRIALS